MVGAIVARTWRLPSEVAVAIRLHHDFTAPNDQRYSDIERHVVAMGLIAEYLVGQYEGSIVPGPNVLSGQFLLFSYELCLKCLTFIPSLVSPTCCPQRSHINKPLCVDTVQSG